jgi:predicted nucleotidyltransferase
MNGKDLLRQIREHVPEIRRRFGVADLAVFGSLARNEAHLGSDVDVLVTFASSPDFDRFMDLKFYLEDLLGVRVDLVTRSALRPELRPQIEGEAIHVA